MRLFGQGSPAGEQAPATIAAARATGFHAADAVPAQAAVHPAGPSQPRGLSGSDGRQALRPRHVDVHLTETVDARSDAEATILRAIGQADLTTRAGRKAARALVEQVALAIGPVSSAVVRAAYRLEVERRGKVGQWLPGRQEKAVAALAMPKRHPHTVDDATRCRIAIARLRVLLASGNDQALSPHARRVAGSMLCGQTLALRSLTPAPTRERPGSRIGRNTAGGD